MHNINKLRLYEAELVCSIINKEETKEYQQEIYNLIQNSNDVDQDSLVEIVFQAIRKLEEPLSLEEIDKIFSDCEEVVGAENLEKDNLVKYLYYYMNINENGDMIHAEKINYLKDIVFVSEENNELQIRVLSDLLFHILQEEKYDFNLMLETKNKLKNLLNKEKENGN
jgi:hypothetical protein